MKNVLKGFWEESFNGLFNADVFVICAFQEVDGIEIEESHPLVGQWKSPEQAQEEASRLGLDVKIVEM